MKTLMIDIEEDGTVHSNGVKKNTWLSGEGYPVFKVGGKHYFVHDAVATKYHGDRKDGMQVNHKDLDKTNNHKDNLEWVTQKANLHHAMDAGVHNWGRSGTVSDDGTGKGHYYPSQAEAAEHTGAQQPNINKVINGLRKTAANLTWRTV